MRGQNKGTEAMKSAKSFWAVPYFWRVRWKEGKSGFEADISRGLTKDLEFTLRVIGIHWSFLSKEWHIHICVLWNHHCGCREKGLDQGTGKQGCYCSVKIKKWWGPIPGQKEQMHRWGLYSKYFSIKKKSMSS